MTDLIAWTLITVLCNVLYFIYDCKELNPRNAADYRNADGMIKERKRNRLFLMGLNTFVLSFWIRKVNVIVALIIMFVGVVIAFLERPC